MERRCVVANTIPVGYRNIEAAQLPYKFTLLIVYMEYDRHIYHDENIYRFITVSDTHRQRSGIKDGYDVRLPATYYGFPGRGHLQHVYFTSQTKAAE